MSKNFSLSTNFVKTDSGMYIIDFFYGETIKEDLYRFYAEPYVYEAILKMIKNYTKVGVIFGYVKKHAEQILPKPDEPEKYQPEFEFESTNFNTFCVERNWMDLINDAEPYEVSSNQIYPSVDTKTFSVVDKDGDSHDIIVNGKYGPLTDRLSSVYLNRLPDQELTDIDVGQSGIIYEFGTDLQMTTLNIFDRKTTIKIIATVYNIMYNFYQSNPDAQWAVFGGYTNERSKMKMYDAISIELAQKLNLQRKVIPSNTPNETFYLIYR